MKKIIRLFGSLTLLATGLLVVISVQTELSADAANPNKITICHRTAAVNNPYRRITVNKSAIASDITENAGGRQGHGQWSHNLWPRTAVDGLADLTSRPDPNVFNPAWKTTYYSVATNKRWGDIIPLTLDNGNQNPNVNAMGLNYSGAGLAIYNGTSLDGVNYGGLCKRQSAAQFCQSLIADGGTLAECQAELDEMGALEDDEVKKACKGSFDGCSLETLSSISARTGTVTCVDKVPTLNGSVATGTLLHNVYFESGTDEFLSSSSNPTRTAATPTSVTGTGTFKATLSALTNGVYYYRAIAIDPANESQMDGAIVSFEVSDSGCKVLSTLEDELIPPGGYFGRLKGVVWIDQNRNGKQDSDEPGLPFTPLTAEITSSLVSSQSVRSSGVSKSSVRKYTVTATTDAFGNYDVPSLEPGSWNVTAKLQTSALERTFDTGGGLTDWFASALVPINGVGEADFAAAGNARVALTVAPTATCTRAKSIEVTWAGIDNKLGTKDDVTFIGTVTQQEAIVRGLPWGSYTVTPICADGTRLAKQTLVITKAQSTKVTKLTVELAPAALPATGSNVNINVLLLAVAMLGAGATFMVPRRRLRR